VVSREDLKDVLSDGIRVDGVMEGCPTDDAEKSSERRLGIRSDHLISSLPCRIVSTKEILTSDMSTPVTITSGPAWRKDTAMLVRWILLGSGESASRKSYLRTSNGVLVLRVPGPARCAKPTCAATSG
jgi:hypothetical protein